MAKKSKSFNIVIYPPKEVSEQAISFSKRLKKKGSLLVLDGKNHFPHVTLYMTEFPLKSVAKVIKLLKQVAAETKPFQLGHLKYRQNKDGYVDVGYRRSKNVNKFQRKIIGLLNPLRDGLVRDKDRMRINQMSATEQKNIRRYGYRSVGARYFPHMTFTKLEKFHRSVLSQIEKMDFSFTATQIGFFHSGEHGTCCKVIEIFDLSKRTCR